MIIPYGIQAYKRADLPQVVLRNLYAEKAESVPGDLVLLPRPALSSYETIGDGPIQGFFYQGGALGDSLFTVSGGNLYSGITPLGNVSTDAIVKMAIADTVLLVATSTALYSTDGTTVAQVAFPDGAGVSSVLYLAGYAIAIRTNSRRIYFTLDTTTWDALDYVSAQQSTSYIVGAAIVIDQLWIFCQDHTEIFYATGDSEAPFQRVQGRVFDKGAASRDSIVNLDNTVFWVGNDRIVYRGEGNPVRISDHGIEQRIADVEPADLVAWAFPWKGHLFYVLSVVGIAYDAATQQWFDIGTYGRNGWAARLGARFGNITLAGDDGSGNIWQLVDGEYVDDGIPLVREFTIVINDNVILDNLAIDCSVGRQPSPDDPASTIELRTSRDGGERWTDWRPASLGKQGASRTYPTWRRLGIVDEGNMIIHVRITDPVASRISYVRINEAQGGRSR